MNIRKNFTENLVTKKTKSEKTAGHTAKKLIGRLTVTLTAVIAGLILAGTMPDRMQKFAEIRQKQTAITAWWGTLYPKFCFSQMPAENKGRKGDIKISLWLAQVLDW